MNVVSVSFCRLFHFQRTCCVVYIPTGVSHRQSQCKHAMHFLPFANLVRPSAVLLLSRESNELFNVDSSIPAKFECPDVPLPAELLVWIMRIARLIFFILRVTDDEGRGNSVLVSLRIDLQDVNDNPPIFEQFSLRRLTKVP